MKRIVGILISGATAAMILLTWGTSDAIAWAVAFCGWVPHCFPDHEATDGDS